MIRNMLLRTVGACATWAFVACSGYSVEVQPAPAETEPTVTPLEAACQEVAIDVAPGADARDDDHVGFVACGGEAPLGFSFVSGAFENGVTPVGTAVATVRCASDDTCTAAAQPAVLGLLSILADAAEPDAVHGAALACGADSVIVTAFVDAHAEAQAEVAARLEALSPAQRDLYVELPQVIATDLDALESTFAQTRVAFEELDERIERELRAGAVSDGLLAEAEGLRDDYVRECLARTGLPFDECITGPIARPLTGRLVEMWLSRRDAVAVRVELALLAVGRDRSTLLNAVAGAQRQRIDDQTAAFAAADAARTQGLSETEIAELYGRPLDLRGAEPIPWDIAPRDYGAAAAELPVLHVSGLVAGVRQRGDYATVRFDRTYVRWDDFRCVTTDEVERFDWRGRIAFLATCPEGDDRLRVDPDDVRVSPGDLDDVEGVIVEAWVDPAERHGRIFRVYGDEEGRTLVRIGPFSVE